MADSKSHQTLVNLLQDGLNGSETMYCDIVNSNLFDDFFKEGNLEESLSDASTEIVRIATFEVGNYKPEEVTWKIEDGSICIRGQKSKSTATGATGSKFCRCVPIPENIIAKTVTARFCVGGGLLVVEGKKQKRPPPLKRKTSKTAFFGDSHFSLSVDLGDGVPVTKSLSYEVQEKQPKEERVQLF
ncbi:uncharacterized protein LOC116302988 [Actinia tenebrosa]|uniref:Uncharacterized protein LOC116302988 n=1 Tax=Actinia tenebrosa TaxID=6105 RepID=A0A6P8IN97_ACTTE|nr:uncharacterized protein LOC116302988 [Actinia tenebrosa]